MLTSLIVIDFVADNTLFLPLISLFIYSVRVPSPKGTPYVVPLTLFSPGGIEDSALPV